MDAKKQEKWAEEVWSVVTNDSEKKHLLRDFYQSLFEHISLWEIEPMRKKLSKNADIVGLKTGKKGKIRMSDFINQLKASLEKNGVTSDKYKLEYSQSLKVPYDGVNPICTLENGNLRYRYELRTNGWGYLFSYAGKNVIFEEDAGFFWGIVFPEYGYCSRFEKISVKELLDFIETGMDELREKYEFKRDYYVNFWRHFMNASLEKRVTAVSAGNISFATLWNYFKIPIEMEARYNESQTDSINIPTLSSIESDPSSKIILPLTEQMNRFVADADKLIITQDPNYYGGFVVKLNEDTAYLRIVGNEWNRELHVYFNPSSHCTCIRPLYSASFAYVAALLYSGLKRVNQLEGLYEDYCKVYDSIPSYTKLYMLKSVGEHKSPYLSNHKICGEDMMPKWYEVANPDNYGKNLLKAVKDKFPTSNVILDFDISYDVLKIDNLTINLFNEGFPYYNSNYALLNPVLDVDVDVDKIAIIRDILDECRFTPSFENPSISIEDIKAAANDGHSDAMISLGLYLLDKGPYKNEMPLQDYKGAALWFEKAIEANDKKSLLLVAYYNLSVMYSKGLGVEKDAAKAKEYLNAYKQFNLPTEIERGFDSPKLWLGSYDYLLLK